MQVEFPAAYPALRVIFPCNSEMRSCHESIYDAIHRPSSDLFRETVGSPLREGRDPRRTQTQATITRQRFAQPMLSIHGRELPTRDRTIPVHREGDLIVGSLHRYVMETLMDSHARYMKRLHLPSSDWQTPSLTRCRNGSPPRRFA